MCIIDHWHTEGGIQGSSPLPQAPPPKKKKGHQPLIYSKKYERLHTRQNL